MPGVPGRSGGQNRKRSEQRLGHANYAADDPRHHENVDKPRAIGKAVQPDLEAVFEEVGRPPLRMVRELWASMTTSGFDEYFTDADWRAAAILMVNLDELCRGVMDGTQATALKLAEIRSIMGDLLVLESARRRLRIEVQRADPDAERPIAPVAHLDLARELA